jgi:hypothetical protein
VRFVCFVVLLAVSGLACTSEALEENACFHQGQVHPVGAEFPAGDGCNTCTCSDDLSVACTENACPDADLPDAGTTEIDAGDGGVDAGGEDAGDGA